MSLYRANLAYPGWVDGDGELHEGPGPDDEHDHAEDLVRVHFVILSFKSFILILTFGGMTLNESKNSMISAAVPM